MGLTLRFLRDERGRPRVMYIRDRLGACPICGHEVIERTYADTSYHHLTVARFRQLAEEAPEGFAHTCVQCGQALDAGDVIRWTLTYGFPLQHGLLQAFWGRGEGESEAEGVYAISPHRELDAQMQPEWEVTEDQSVAVFDEPTEADVHAVTGRHLSLKAAWRRLLSDYLRSGSTELAVAELASGYWAIIGVGPSEALVDVALERLGADRSGDGPPSWVLAPLADPINRLVDAGPADWLPAAWLDTLDVLDAGSVWAVAAGDLRWAAEHFRAVMAELPVETVLRLDADQSGEVVFPVGPGERVPRPVSLRALLLESLVTGSAPSDGIALWLDDCLVEVTRRATPTGE